MSYKLNEKNLRRLCNVNYFPIPADKMIFFGFRGCYQFNPEDHLFKSEQTLELIDVNYINCRCTLGQWLPENKEFAIFPGSSVPHKSYIKQSITTSGEGANQLMTGYYSEYRKGIHCPGKPTAHDAFRQVNFQPISRTSNDLVFDNDDRVEYENPNDNIHAGWCMGVNATMFSSRGCQVLVGYPKCKSRGQLPAIGPWKIFVRNAHNLSQESFIYILLTGREVARVVSSGMTKISARLRFGSKGDLVEKLQKALNKKGFYEGIINGEFDVRTLRAVMRFQIISFGPNAEDGIVGPITASALGLKWPNI